MILKTILCVQHFCSFAAILFIVNVLSIAEKYCHVTIFEKWPLSNMLSPWKHFLEQTEFLPKDLNFYHGDF